MKCGKISLSNNHNNHKDHNNPKSKTFPKKNHLLYIWLKKVNSNLICACEMWGQTQNNLLFERISNLQVKALRVTNFKRKDAPTDPLFKDNKY